MRDASYRDIFVTSKLKSRLRSDLLHGGISFLIYWVGLKRFPGFVNQLRVYAETGTPSDGFQGACNATHAPPGSTTRADWTLSGLTHA